MATFDVLSNKNFDKSSKSPKSAFTDNLHIKSKYIYKNKWKIILSILLVT